MHCICGSALTIILASTTLAEVKLKGSPLFVIEAACDATTSIRTKKHPFRLKPGDRFQAFSLNKNRDASHIRVRINGDLKWVALACGRLTGGSEELPGNRTTDRACLPFFDSVDNPVQLGVGGRVDITPDPSKLKLNRFDKAVQKICGPAGKAVSASEFKSLMRANMEVLKSIYAFTGGQVFANRPKPANLDAYLEDLREVWFNNHGFEHIYCGEPGSKGGIGGLHFHGRYLQLQKSQEACRLENFSRNEVMEGAIYTMGVRMKNADNKFVRHEMKGYGLTLSAEDILKAVTLAFRQNPTQSSKNLGCIVSLKDDGKAFKAVFVRTAAGIRTFFPDATPNAGRYQNPYCSNEIILN